MAHALKDDESPAPPVTVAQRPPDVTPEQWEARMRQAQTTLVKVLLRARERLIAEGKLPPD